MRRYALSATLLLVTGAAYLPALRGEFFSDDLHLAEASFPGPSMEALRDSLRGTDGSPRNLEARDILVSFRPVSNTWLLIERWTFGSVTLGYHLTNLFLHLAAIVAAHLLFTCWMGPGLVSFLSAAIFALHPFQTGAVAWINGLSDVLMFLGLVAALSAVRSKGSLIAKCGWGFSGFLWALLCKETAVVWVGLVPILTAGRRRREKISMMATSVTSLVAWLCLRRIALEEIAFHSVPGEIAWLLKAPVFLLQTPIYLLRLFSVPAVIQYADIPGAVPGFVQTAAGVSILAALALLYLRALRTPGEGSRAHLFFFFFVFVLFLLPVVYIHELSCAAPRMYYAPIFGLAGIIGMTAKALAEKLEGRTPWIRLKPVRIVCLFFVVALLAAATWMRARDYKSGEAFWRSEIANYPNGPYGYHFVGYYRMREGRFAEALPYSRRAHELAPEMPRVLNNLGLNYLNLGQLDRAQAAFEKMLGLAERGTLNDCRARYHLGLVARAKGDLGSARGWARDSSAHCPHYRRAQVLDRELGSIDSGRPK